MFSFFIIVSAQINPFDIQFPVSELGNCGSTQECKIYCDDPANARACTDWAVSKGFAQSSPKNEYQEKSREVVEQREGPGGCRGQKECDTFCSQPEHNEECFNFAKENDLMPPEEIRRVEKDMRREGPNGCRSRQECDAFCRNPDNNKTCLNFAVQEGKITREEADFMSSSQGSPRVGRPMPPQIDENKAKQILAEKGGPEGCKTIEECGAFCSQPENGETCFNFAVEQGLMPAQEIERAKKMMGMKGPGGCRGQKECDSFCSQPEHGEECFNFAKENGLMPPEEIQKMERGREIINKLEKQGGGPGDCRGGEECHRYCSNTSNFDECAAFSVKEGMMDMNKARGMMKEFEGFMPGQPGPEGFGPPAGFEDKFNQRFEVFENRREEFMKRDDFCGKPENAEQCRGPMPNVPMMPRSDGMRPPEGVMPGRMMPPQEFPGKPGEFPGRSGEFPAPQEFREGTMPEQFMPPSGMPPIPSGGTMTPLEGIPMPNQMPGEIITPPPPPSSSLKLQYLIGTILAPFLDVLR